MTPVGADTALSDSDVGEETRYYHQHVLLLHLVHGGEVAVTLIPLLSMP